MSLQLKRSRSALPGQDWIVLRVHWRPSWGAWSGSIAWLRVGERIFHLGNWRSVRLP